MIWLLKVDFPRLLTLPEPGTCPYCSVPARACPLSVLGLVASSRTVWKPTVPGGQDALGTERGNVSSLCMWQRM